MIAFTVVMMPVDSYWKDKSAIVAEYRVHMDKPAEVMHVYKIIEQLATHIMNSDLRCIIVRQGDMILDNLRGIS